MSSSVIFLRLDSYLNEMKINWIPKVKAESENLSALIQTEYKFRSLVTKTLLETVDGDIDFDAISFDFNTKTRVFRLSPSTPEPFYSHLIEIEDLLK